MNKVAAIKRVTLWIICPPREHLFRVQSLRALINYFATFEECNCVVFSLLDSDDLQQARSDFPRARVISLGENVRPGAPRLAAALAKWAPVLRNSVSQAVPQHLVLIDKWGLLLLPLVNIKMIRTTYLNFELRINSETQRFSRKIVNTVEGYLHRLVGATIIQDEWRWRALKAEHSLPDDHSVFYLPNAPIGKSNIVYNKALRLRFSVPSESTLLVYIGSLVDHFMIRELVDAVIESKELFLLIHSPSTSGFDNEVRNLIRSTAEYQGNVYLSEDMLKPWQLDELMQGSDIGVSLIKPVVGNVLNEELMGFSSGKMCAYMQNGLPVITSKLRSVEWIEESGSGVCIPSLNKVSLREAARKIMEDRSSYSRNSAAFFDKRLSLDNYLPALKTHIFH